MGHVVWMDRVVGVRSCNIEIYVCVSDLFVEE